MYICSILPFASDVQTYIFLFIIINTVQYLVTSFFTVTLFSRKFSF
jgi:hypothetical protein